MDVASHWPLPTGLALRDELIAAYGSDSRGYHDLRHLAEVLARLDELASHLEFDSVVVALAAWFHDGVYDGESGTEERSAAWAESALARLGLPADQVAEVARLVRLTAHHRPTLDDRNGCALSDADLAILASPPARYLEYVADVRREYAHVPKTQFATGRAEILIDLMSQPTLFRTPYAVSVWEADARRNVEAEIRGLTEGEPT